jgi:Tfp pilus assembly protein PilN
MSINLLPWHVHAKPLFIRKQVMMCVWMIVLVFVCCGFIRYNVHKRVALNKISIHAITTLKAQVALQERTDQLRKIQNQFVANKQKNIATLLLLHDNLIYVANALPNDMVVTSIQYQDRAMSITGKSHTLSAIQTYISALKKLSSTAHIELVNNTFVDEYFVWELQVS